MTKKYNQLTLVQRYKIEALLLAGNTQTAIASILGVHRSTICREFKRNVPKRGVESGFYVAAKANAKTKQRYRSKAKHIKLTQELKKQASASMTDKRLTPELISARWRKQGFQGVRHETGYRFIWRRPNGRLQPARGQAIIPSARILRALLLRAEEEGWFA